MQDQPDTGPAPTPPPPCPHCGHRCPTGIGSSRASSPEQAAERLPAAVVALVAGRLYQAPQEALEALMQETPARNLLLALADFSAWMIDHTVGGPHWLERAGLTYAQATAEPGEA
ncbi:hypothetical protein [Streptomyces hokutonensis]|uniref:hypothetical protein n=1 Tax=Streptomyces hokutonensis TaxID=1306990 RepID=UPI00037F53AA|nr:hypothetical protein [Streptomyces hokutonensis]